VIWLTGLSALLSAPLLACDVVGHVNKTHSELLKACRDGVMATRNCDAFTTDIHHIKTSWPIIENVVTDIRKYNARKVTIKTLELEQ